MGPEKPSTHTDRESETVLPRRGRPPVPPEHVLAAADRVFASVESPTTVTMDDIAAAAGVGKGTLFRAFGSRDGLLDALFEAHLSPLRKDVERPDSPVGSLIAPNERLIALLDELLTFKLKNPHLTTAREQARPGLHETPHYAWVHDLLAAVVMEAGADAAASDYAAHVLLAALRVDLIHHLLATGHTPDDLRLELTSLARALLTGHGTKANISASLA